MRSCEVCERGREFDSDRSFLFSLEMFSFFFRHRDEIFYGEWVFALRSVNIGENAGDQRKAPVGAVLAALPSPDESFKTCGRKCEIFFI